MPRNTTHPTERILGLFLGLPKAEQALTLIAVNAVLKHGAGAPVKRAPKSVVTHVPAPGPVATVVAVEMVPKPPRPAKRKQKSRAERKAAKLSQAERTVAVMEASDPGLPPEEYIEPEPEQIEG